MQIVLRPYQEELIKVIWEALPDQKYILIQAGTGAGKTIVFSELIKRLLNQWSIRIAILAHRRELITQARDKLLKVWPEAPIGIACASVSSKKEIESAVTIGSIQTLINEAGNTEPFDVIICDEAHKIPPISQKSQYKEWIETMNQYNPNVRLIGFTATPFRLGHGYIFGKVCRSGNQNLFDSLNYCIGLKKLQEQGFLCKYRAKELADVSMELKTIKCSGGEYNLRDLSEMMSREIHIGSAVQAFQKYGENRKHVVVFAVTIEHAEKLKLAFKKVGFIAAAVHSKMPINKRNMFLKEFDAGRIRFLINIGILTEGWDSPHTDCIIMCRPTKSPALFVQMTGRGLRLHPDKEDVLILDLASNCKEHGEPDSPKIHIPGRKKNGGGAPFKTCPKCNEMVHPLVMECPSCKYIWTINEQNSQVEMKNVHWSQPKSEPFTMNVISSEVEGYTSKAGNHMLKLCLICGGGLTKSFVNTFFMFDRESHPYARQKSRRLWKNLVGTKPPEDVEEAMDRSGELIMNIPETVEVVEDGRWLKVANWQVAEEEVPF